MTATATRRPVEAVMTHAERRARREKIRAYIEAGHSLKQAMEKFDIGYQMAWSACGSDGPNRPKATSFVILRRLLDGDSTSALGREFGVSKQRVDEIKRTAQKAGFAFPKKNC